ncbi:unnamed protein product [Dicrocoelium dendriticum]|nr:unnamed protein product [Dicrocoelium dendriticum]
MLLTVASLLFLFQVAWMAVLSRIVHHFSQQTKIIRNSTIHLLNEIHYIVRVEPRAVGVVVVGAIVCLCLLALLIACNSSNSLSLTAFTHLIIFDLLSLMVALTSLWTKRKSASLREYNLGYERFEVVAVFSATILAILSSFFEIKEAVERLFEPVEVNCIYALIMCPIALLIHLLTVYGIDNPAFGHVILASSSSWLQEHTTDVSRTLCRLIPGLSRILLPRVNPFALVGVASSSVVLCVCWMMRSSIERWVLAETLVTSSPTSDPSVDTIGGLIISLMLFGTMMPMMLYSGRILLQTVPSHLVGPLDKAFREASTTDGVLELRNEHVWSLGFGNLVGSLYVRVRQDANEQLVLAHVTNRLSSLIKYLTVQVYKDDWTRTSTTFSWPPTSIVAHTSVLSNSPLSYSEIYQTAKPNFIPPSISRVDKPFYSTNQRIDEKTIPVMPPPTAH